MNPYDKIPYQRDLEHFREAQDQRRQNITGMKGLFKMKDGISN